MKPENTVTGNQIEPPHINQKQRNGYIAVKYISFLDALSKSTGAKARPSNTNAKIEFWLCSKQLETVEL